MNPPGNKPARPADISAARDLYEILNVPRKASSREIRRAYRELARKFHPDFNPGDEAAAKKFREVHEAYEILGDAKKRRAYDYYGADFGDRIPARAPNVARQPSVARPSSPLGANPLRPAARDFRPSPFPSAASFPRLATRARLGSLTVAIVFVFGTIGYLMLPDAGVKEFERAQEALKYVHSWKVEGRIFGSDSATGEYLVEVSCPSSERTTRHVRNPASAAEKEFVLETVAVGNDSYSRVSWGNRWNHSSISGTAASFACAYVQRGQDGVGLPPFHQWRNGSFVISKQNLRQTPDGSCREWKVVTPGGFSHAPDLDFVCLGVRDHLPRFRGAPGSVAEERFYDWNVPNEIVAPPVGDSR